MQYYVSYHQSEADSLRERGNDAFRRGDWAAAEVRPRPDRGYRLPPPPALSNAPCPAGGHCSNVPDLHLPQDLYTRALELLPEESPGRAVFYANRAACAAKQAAARPR